MAKQQKRWGKKIAYIRDWRRTNEIYVKKAAFYLDFDWVKSWKTELAEKQMKALIDDGCTINTFFGDGAFPTHKLFDFCDQHKIKTAIKIGKSANPEVEGSWRRSVEVKKYKKLGYKKWAEQNEYGGRWTGTEGIFSAVKKMYGGRVRAHKIENMCLKAERKFWAYQLIKRYAEEKIALGN